MQTFFVFGAVLIGTSAWAQDKQDALVLWQKGMPEPKVDALVPEEIKVASDGTTRRYNISNPRLLVFPAAANKRSGAGVIVIPGGGLGLLADEHEGSEACQWLSRLGITSFLLLHRCPTNKHPRANLGPVQDTQKAVQIVRARAAEWNLDLAKIGVLGFSAGGQIALVAATNERLFPHDDDVGPKHTPDFLLLLYPYQIYDAKAKALRADVKLGATLPPMFIAQTADDQGSLAQGSTLLFLELLQRKIPSELHIYERGGHGYGMRARAGATGPSDWPHRAADWLRQRKFALVD